MELEKAKLIAEKIKSLLSPHCEKCEIAGSIRREKVDVKDIEIVCIPKLDEVFHMANQDFQNIVNSWTKVKGEPTGRYTQRILPEGIKLDLFIVDHGNFGIQIAIRTGSSEYSHRVLATTWVKRGYKSENGYLYKEGKRYEFTTEQEFFDHLQIPYLHPKYRFLINDRPSLNMLPKDHLKY